jgi:hypothetical protein
MAERKPPPRIYRRCPACETVRPASEYPRSMSGQGARFGSGWRSRCPSCGHVGATRNFPQVEPPPRRRCRGVSKDGAPCGLLARPGADFCRHHLPPAGAEGAGGAEHSGAEREP